TKLIKNFSSSARSTVDLAARSVEPADGNEFGGGGLEGAAITSGDSARAGCGTTGAGAGAAVALHMKEAQATVVALARNSTMCRRVGKSSSVMSSVGVTSKYSCSSPNIWAFLMLSIPRSASRSASSSTTSGG